MDRLRVFIRETVQNTWDAREEGAVPEYKVRIRNLDKAQQRFLTTEVLAPLPADSHFNQHLGSVSQEFPVLLEISDFGTKGLGGPSRADLVTGSEARDFVDFVLNIGSPRDVEQGGGTYGYGKSASYVLSRASTILIHTRSLHDDQEVERFMGARLGTAFDHNNRRYTGRHWWGRLSGDVIEPATAAEARILAAGMGFPERAAGVKGATIAVIAPDFDGKTLQEAANTIAECLVWNFWPKMLGNTRRSMSFSLEGPDGIVEIPLPEDFPPIHLAAKAMREIDINGPNVQVLESLRPKKELGKISATKGLRLDRVVLDTGDEKSIIPDNFSHIALMRPAELVVCYLQGPTLSSDYFEYGGVFIVDQQLESIFARAEPPAHDDWIPDKLAKKERTFVNVAFSRMRSFLADFSLPAVRDFASAEHEDGISLAGLSRTLGRLVGGLSRRPGSERTEFRTGGSRGPGRGRVSVSHTGFEEFDRQPSAIFRLEASHGCRQLRPYVFVDGVKEQHSADGITPWIVASRAPGGTWLDGTPEENDLNGKVDLEIAVTLIGDCMVGLEAK